MLSTTDYSKLPNCRTKRQITPTVSLSTQQFRGRRISKSMGICQQGFLKSQHIYLLTESINQALNLW